ncbi:C4-dicarboxylate transport transcriptional regulatory protein DctD [Candidatus Terasakiella magnetica]|uniref:C4-dicarboxylate transport transcriptional regulatory protein DctD n=1 Tax=Candidatus Terasakiella magnetica TaxID=1867952 RepID=A0A1C3RDQ6_9PROT|nr:sigma-54 dependent transcriptional regulator [Candidatus Terasakiella magnetica]SCA55361.1 C4-dicarboxylate transport transcriptional regulatory protein DctD [Candidatus Terasakiella magnetica]
MSTDNKPTFRVIVIDDDKEMRESLVHLLETTSWQVDTFTRADSFLERIDSLEPDVILSDYRMPGMDGMEMLRQLKLKNVRVPVVLISAHGDIPMAVEAMQIGAYTFLEKPFDPRRLLSVLKHAAEQHRLNEDAERLKARLAQLSGLDRILIGQTEEISRLREDILNFSDVDAPIMLLGETGTGKEVVARALHDLSNHANGPFVVLNCATIPAERFEISMFGEAATSPGVLASADGGTLFLDEIGACPAPVQAKLLRAIETREYIPVGGEKAIPTNMRILSATNENLEAGVANGDFRADLLYRLNTLVLNLPTLRERRSDVVLLFSHFLAEYGAVYEVGPPELKHEDVSALMSHDWPGNVRELRHVAERLLLAARRGRGSVAEAIKPDHDHGDVPDTLREAVAAFERELIAKAIKTHQGKMDAVAESLGIGRRTLNEKIVKLGLDKNALI